MRDACPICQTPLEPGQSSCEVCGFNLSGTTQSFSPVEAPDPLASRREEVKDAPASTPTLRMVRGPQRGAEYKLNAQRTLIGRDPQYEVFLNDMTVSRLHASIQESNGIYMIQDEQSFNGVWVNNRSVTNKVLESGDFVQIGRYGFIFDSGEE